MPGIEKRFNPVRKTSEGDHQSGCEIAKSHPCIYCWLRGGISPVRQHRGMTALWDD